jgi:hypothetical protein
MNKQHYKLIKKGYDKGMQDKEICPYIIGKNGKAVSVQYINQYAKRHGFIRADRPVMKL